MREVTGKNFGILIAYLLPGLVILWGLSFHSPTIRSWLGSPAVAPPTVGGFLYVTVAAIAAGLTASTIRWMIIDSIHHRTGLTPRSWDFALLQANLEVYQLLEGNHYKYYQWYSNMVVAVLLAYATARWSDASLSWRADIAAGGVVLLFFAGSRDTLRKYYRRVDQLMGLGHQHEGRIGRQALSAGVSVTSGQVVTVRVASRHQLGKWHAQCLGQPLNVDQRNVAFTTFDTADVSPVQTSQFGELLLGNSFFESDLPEFGSESNQDVSQDRLLVATNGE